MEFLVRKTTPGPGSFNMINGNFIGSLSANQISRWQKIKRDFNHNCDLRSDNLRFILNYLITSN